MTEKIPVVILNGFLGSGKTTLFRNLLSQAKRKNISICDVGNKAQIIKTDATKKLPTLSKKSFDTVFIDPPYGKGLGQKALKILKECQLLNKETLIILEEGQQINSVESFSIKDCRRYGSSYAHFLTPNVLQPFT